MLLPSGTDMVLYLRKYDITKSTVQKLPISKRGLHLPFGIELFGNTAHWNGRILLLWFPLSILQHSQTVTSGVWNNCRTHLAFYKAFGTRP